MAVAVPDNTWPPHVTAAHRTNTHEPTHSTQQRQQPTIRHPQTPPNPPLRPSTPSSHPRSLRRTPRFEASPTSSSSARQPHIAAASIGFNPRHLFPNPDRSDPQQDSAFGLSIGPRREHNRERAPSRDLAHDFEEETSDHPGSANPPPSSSQQDRPEPHPALRISKRTHTAILFALEEALRYPNPFTSDLAEESASMADVIGSGSNAATSNGNAMQAPRRPTAAPAPTSSPSGIRGPRMIMQERAAREKAREERQRAEAEEERKRLEQERLRAEHEARVAEEARRRNAERRSAGDADGQSFVDPNRQGQPAPQTPLASRPAHASQHQQLNPAHQSQQTQQLASRFNRQAASQLPPTADAQHQAQQPSQDASAQQLSASKPRNSFPHAFERWETLSAHWEGLTSYWIRKLEQNKDEVNRDPVSQQLARQVTDLSAAGANLFHAVVELQRLRASSERKFQRWFFETRAELERAQEVKGILEATLEKERRERAEAIRNAIDQEKGSSKAQKQLAEMRKELAISKEEARRAWEELGRREQEERDKTFALQASLQSGQPTFVGGVQVVPMTTQNMPGRYADSREYEQMYAPDPPEAVPGHPHPSTTTPGGTPGSYYRSQTSGSQQPPPAAPMAPRSEGGFSDGEYVIDAQGNFVLDSQGNRIAFAAPPSTISGSDADAEEYETPATTNPPSGGYDIPTTSAAGASQWAPAPAAQDYSGQGYGPSGWEPVPRHHHPTRLSDVIEEEDEKSRTSNSQVSRG
ncbi:hypothetical protein B0I35DRAFT_479396 [Stachybotrys elegans]|uniref:Uncharacterized protein n=1 Tax=Stachybotrys elegans TaxID=80388 RepID=A0A8K0WQ86_9HYPO|nr:hypothetical protein B0I35DRAFT_479396 [Stachybotrys elegans]